MKNSVAVLCLLILATSASAEVLVFRDSNCQVLSPNGSKVEISKGEEAEYKCEVTGNEAVCHFKNLATGKKQGEPTTFQITNYQTAQIWSSAPSGNVKMIVDKNTGHYQYGMTTILFDQGTMVSKECVGTYTQHGK